MQQKLKKKKKKKREIKQMKIINTTTLKSATYFKWALDGLLWH